MVAVPAPTVLTVLVRGTDGGGNPYDTHSLTGSDETAQLRVTKRAKGDER